MPAAVDVTPRSRIDEEKVRAIPKAEVHVHLEGNFDLIDLLDLAKAAGEPLPGPAATLLDIGTHYEFEMPDVTTGGGASNGAGVGGLTGFLRFLDWECGLIRTSEQAARHAYTFAVRQSASGIRYTDAIINPTHWSAWNGRMPQLFAAFAAGFDEAEQDGLCIVNLCVSILRQQEPQEGVELAEWLVNTRPARVVALSIDGDERTMARSGARFAEAFTIAKDAGFRRTVHAGESSGPESIWDAIRMLHAERIDHGVRAIEDPSLMAYLADEQISLGLCPRSNIALGLYDDWAKHPILTLRDAGIPITLNTDDPGPIGIRLESEWTTFAQTFGLGMDDMFGLASASVEASFADDGLKAGLRAEIGALALAQ